jgi:SNF2 family DNA or RNA helicase
VPSSVPASLTSKRGVKGVLLRSLPNVWLVRPGTRQVQVPQFEPSLASNIGIEWCVTPTVTVPLVWTLGGVSADLCDWPFRVAANCFRPFSVRIFGTRYRSRVEPSVGDDNREARSRPSREGLPHSSSSWNPYAHLYCLLYPPPDEVIAEQIQLPATLHDYQHVGIEFLVKREHALLADDMGLGKTAQCVVALAVLRRTERVNRALIICPRAVVRQWQREARQWAGLRVMVVDGPPAGRKRLWKNAAGVLLTTPNIVLNDRELVQQYQFDLVVCDDVAPLKSPGKITAAIRSIRRARSWCLNGTPLENKPEDFANVMEFVSPGLFSAGERLKAPSRSELQERVKPFFLRRRKTDHLDLPPKITVDPTEIELDGRQLEEYRKAEQRRWQVLEDASGQLTKLHIFQVINELIRL